MVAAQPQAAQNPVRLGGQRAIGEVQQLDAPGQLLVAQEQRVGRGMRQAPGGLGLGHVDTRALAVLPPPSYHGAGGKGSVRCRWSRMTIAMA